MDKYKIFKCLIRPFYNMKTIKLYKAIREEYEWNECKRSLKSIGEDSYLGADCHITGGQYIEVGSNVKCGRGLLLEAWDQYNYKRLGKPEIMIHDHVTFTEYTHISAVNKVEIGEGCLFGRYVYISDNDHGDCNDVHNKEVRPVERDLHSKGGVVIGKNVWIGDKVSILSGVTVGDNAVIGANSVVTKSVPEGCIVAGVPAKVIKKW